MSEEMILLRKMLKAKEHVKEIRAQMLVHAVECMGVPQEVAKQLNLDDYYNGYVAARGEFE